jgi:hypothetical protein
MREGREERFEGLEYRQEVSNGYERVNASNSCVRILIFGSSSFIVFMLVFFLFIHSFSSFLCSGFFIVSPLSIWFFYRFPSFALFIIFVFRLMCVSFLAYLTCVGQKGLVVVP